MALKFARYRDRRIAVGKLERIYKWEFWPVQVFYIPVVVYVLYLAARQRSLTVFTAANPAIPAGGFKGESKDEIYSGLRRSAPATGHLLAHLLIGNELSADERVAQARHFVETNRLTFPLAVKPDAGERGAGVRYVRDQGELMTAVASDSNDLIVQEFAEGLEISAFYYRYPLEERGHIFSITEKRFPIVTGDGRSTLERLILSDTRAVCLADKYIEQNKWRLAGIPAAGEQVQLVEIGTHSRGAIFLDGRHLLTPTLEDKIDEICRGFRGFYFGRFDIRAESIEDLQHGSFKIIELNGVTSESTNIYDPRYSLIDAYRILFRQWRIAFEIGAANIARGEKAASIRDLVRLSIGVAANPRQMQRTANPELRSL
jgi:hypothetical protein